MFSDIFEELKSNPKFIYLTAAGVAFIVLLFSISLMDFDSNKQKLTLTDKASLAPDEGIPADMFVPFKKAEPEPEPPPPPPKAPEKVELNIEDLIAFKQKEEPELSRHEILRRELAKQRKKTGSITVIGQDIKKIKLNRDEEIIDVSQDDDFSKHGLKQSNPTYPVDLSRTLTADRFIPAVLITEIKSELPSAKVIAMVEQDVYAAHGEKILIPRGSRAIGSYEPLAEVDSERLMIAWNRIITPEGINIKLTAETADGVGSAGSTGKIDNRLYDKYSTALLFSSISALAQLTVSTENEQQSAAAEAFSSEFGTITAESLRNALDVLPRVTIPAGGRLNISPLVDIWMPEPLQKQSEVIPVKDLENNGKLALARFQRGEGKPLLLTEKDIKNDEVSKIELSSPFPNNSTVKSNDTNGFKENLKSISDEDFLRLLQK